MKKFRFGYFHVFGPKSEGDLAFLIKKASEGAKKSSLNLKRIILSHVWHDGGRETFLFGFH